MQYCLSVHGANTIEQQIRFMREIFRLINYQGKIVPVNASIGGDNSNHISYELQSDVSDIFPK